ncbi:hypothetical protein U8607_19135 [Methylobacterium durans]|jgi:hypothetical protein|uniref:Uncharacterized protein n=1 Tax=Methylobacterium durans TaxID=2202825 RepID=A0A2U8WEH0_9HYPH|nr:hypothetical protein [Methylobacterium durans]AWN43938.1 hypothetical protein DK389_29785 [Methylobacterium durans]MEA1834210.1 hypothetical protein [Methylobacterium durans]
MSDAHEQLVAALRTIVAEGEDPWTIIDHAMEDVERAQGPSPASAEEAPGPYAPNPLSIYAERLH